jgi:carbon monoxide dehydrogenase subunit G
VKLEQTFEVGAPVEQVWSALIDVEHVAPCLPGAAVTGRNEDGSYNGTFSVKIGPTTASYTGKLVMEQVDEQAHTATMQAQGTDKRGQGGAKATIVSTVVPIDGGGTQVEVNTDYHITGRLARFGRGGMIEDISQRLLREFAERLAASLDAGGASADAAEPAVEPEAGAPEPEAGAPEPEAGALQPEAGSGEEAGEDDPADPAPAPKATTAFVAPPPAEPLDAGSMVGSVLADRVRSNPLPLLAGLVALVLLRRRRRRRRRRPLRSGRGARCCPPS